MFSSFLAHVFSNATFLAILVLVVLSIYLVVVFWVFMYRYKITTEWITVEKKSLDALLMGDIFPLSDSMMFNCLEEDQKPQKAMLDACKQKALVKATKGLSLLSIISSTAPFIGLFGTVVSILDAFAGYGDGGSVMFSAVAPAISEALIATAAGIFVAIFAYTFHQILQRKCFELMSVLNIITDVVLARVKL